jgi:hypothetical protein
MRWGLILLLAFPLFLKGLGEKEARGIERGGCHTGGCLDEISEVTWLDIGEEKTVTTPGWCGGWVKFDVKAGATYVIALLGPEDQTPSLWLYNEYRGAPCQYVRGWYSHQMFEFITPKNGNLWLNFRPSRSKHVSFRLHLEEFLVGASPGRAFPLVVGQPLTRNVTSWTYSLWYRFNATAGFGLVIDLKHFSANKTFGLFLFENCSGEACRQLGQSGYYGSSNLPERRLLYTPLSNTTFWLNLSPWRMMNNVAFQLWIKTLDQVEAGAAPGKPIPISIGEEVTRTTSPDIGVWYSWNASKGNIYVVELKFEDHVSTNIDLFVYQNCTNMQTSCDHKSKIYPQYYASGYRRLFYSATANTLLMLQIVHGKIASNAPFQLWIKTLDQVEVGAAPGKPIYISVGEEVTRTISVVDVWYSWNASKGITYVAELKFEDHVSTDLDLTLYCNCSDTKAQCNYLGWSRRPGRDQRLVYSATTNGLLWLRIFPRKIANSGMYQLRVRTLEEAEPGVAPGKPVQLIVGQKVTRTISSLDVWHSWNASKGDSYVVDVTCVGARLGLWLRQNCSNTHCRRSYLTSSFRNSDAISTFRALYTASASGPAWLQIYPVKYPVEYSRNLTYQIVVKMLEDAAPGAAPAKAIQLNVGEEVTGSVSDGLGMWYSWNATKKATYMVNLYVEVHGGVDVEVYTGCGPTDCGTWLTYSYGDKPLNITAHGKVWLFVGRSFRFQEGKVYPFRLSVTEVRNWTLIIVLAVIGAVILAVAGGMVWWSCTRRGRMLFKLRRRCMARLCHGGEEVRETFSIISLHL